MRVAGDREICMGAGVCVMTADQTFDQDDAVRMCPSGALRIVAD